MFLSDFLEFIASHSSEILEQTGEHLSLTLTALFFSVLIGLLLGIISVLYSKLEKVILPIINGIQTIPSIALLGFMIPLLGIGEVPAIVALFLYGLLPIVKNTITGIKSVDKTVVESAFGMGFTRMDILRKVELPLALPVIFTGVRVAFVINIGVATLCALIAAGGLGEYIFRGLSTNNTHMILAGALPAALLALIFDWLLSFLQKYVLVYGRWIALVGFIITFLSLLFYSIDVGGKKVVAGFPSEFIERADGYRGLDSVYMLDLDIKEMEIGLMYKALKNKNVDVISGFSTDGRIQAFNLQLLVDNKNYFPPYHAAPLVRNSILDDFPEIKTLFNNFSGVLTDKVMQSLNYKVDQLNISPVEVAESFLDSLGYSTNKVSSDNPQVLIGSKNFTESYILAEMFSLLIEGELGISTSLKPGFGGTSLIFQALEQGDIDLYPEYTGTGLLVILNNTDRSIRYQRDSVYNFVQKEFDEKYNISWLKPLGFNNTFALMVRRPFAERNKLETISDLKKRR